MNLAKAVANAAAMLVLKAKNVAQVAEDTVLQNRVIAAATQCALSTSQLVACAKVRVCVWVTFVGASRLSETPRALAAVSFRLFFSVLDSRNICCLLSSVVKTICYLLCWCTYVTPAGRQPHHQFPGVPGAAHRSRKAGGSLGGKLHPGLPLGHRGRRAAKTGRSEARASSDWFGLMVSN